MFYTLLFIHIVLCVVLIGLVLMQQGKGADMGAAFGGSSSSLFGAGGATDFVTKLTTSLAIAFMVTSILLVRAYTSFSETAGVSVNNPLEGSVIVDEPAVQAPAAAVAPDAAVVPQAGVGEAGKIEVKPAQEVKAEAKTVEVKPEAKKDK